MHVRSCHSRPLFDSSVVAVTGEADMKREYIQRGILVLFVSMIAGGFYFAFGWAGLAFLAVFELYEIAYRLSEIRDRLSARSAADVS
jgi:hypothetical protein